MPGTEKDADLERIQEALRQTQPGGAKGFGDTQLGQTPVGNGNISDHLAPPPAQISAAEAKEIVKKSLAKDIALESRGLQQAKKDALQYSSMKDFGPEIEAHKQALNEKVSNYKKADEILGNKKTSAGSSAKSEASTGASVKSPTPETPKATVELSDEAKATRLTARATARANVAKEAFDSGKEIISKGGKLSEAHFGALGTGFTGALNKGGLYARANFSGAGKNVGNLAMVGLRAATGIGAAAMIGKGVIDVFQFVTGAETVGADGKSVKADSGVAIKGIAEIAGGGLLGWVGIFMGGKGNIMKSSPGLSK